MVLARPNLVWQALLELENNLRPQVEKLGEQEARGAFLFHQFCNSTTLFFGLISLVSQSALRTVAAAQLKTADERAAALKVSYFSCFRCLFCALIDCAQDEPVRLQTNYDLLVASQVPPYFNEAASRCTFKWQCSHAVTLQEALKKQLSDKDTQTAQAVTCNIFFFFFFR